jgi:hypothetical protein
MADSTLLAIVGQRCMEVGAVGGDTMAGERTTAMKYYKGEKFGDELEGRSQVVSRDVAESIDSTLPSLMRIFAGGDQVVLCEPSGPNQEDAAEQATDYANYVWMRVNPGFRISYWWFKDALLQKLGIIKIWWDATEKVTREEYEALTEAQADEMRANPDIEVIEESDPRDPEPGEPGYLAPPPPSNILPPSLPGMAQPAAAAPVSPPSLMALPPPMAGLPGQPPMQLPISPPAPPKLVDMVVLKTNRTGRICVENVPNEEFGMTRTAIAVEDADYTHHRRQVTLSELRAMGFPQKQIDAIPSDDLIGLDVEKQERFEDQGGVAEEIGTLDPTMRKVWLTEAYLRVDYDGDGVAEMRKVTWASTQIFVNEQTDENPFACCTPTLMPHKAIGMSMADQTMDLQRIKSTLFRNFLDNTYLQSAPALAVNDDAVVDYNEWLTRRVGQVLRTKGLPGNAFAPLPTQFIGGEIFPAIEYIDSVREQRTGASRMNQGLDPDTLNKTATGINILSQASGQRIELIARAFAETGVKPAFVKIIRLASQYVRPNELVRLRGKWVPMDPRAWADGFDMTVSVGLGTGNKDQQVAHMAMLLQMDQQIVALQGGVQGPILTAENIYKKLEKLVQAMGMPSAAPYYSDPGSPEMQAAQQAAQAGKQPPPEVQVAQIAGNVQMQAAKLQQQTDLQKAAMQSHTDANKAATQQQTEVHKAVLGAQSHAAAQQQDTKGDIAAAMIQSEAQKHIEAMRLASAEQQTAMKAHADMMTDRFKAMLDAHTKLLTQHMQAQQQPQQPAAPA